jgi:hypothetical protein
MPNPNALKYLILLITTCLLVSFFLTISAIRMTFFVMVTSDYQNDAPPEEAGRFDKASCDKLA